MVFSIFSVKDKIISSFRTHFPSFEIDKTSIEVRDLNGVESVSFRFKIPEGCIVKIGEGYYSPNYNRIVLSEPISSELEIGFFQFNSYDKTELFNGMTNTSKSLMYVMYNTSVMISEILKSGESLSFHFPAESVYKIKSANPNLLSRPKEQRLSISKRIQWLKEEYPLFKKFGYFYTNRDTLGSCFVKISVTTPKSHYILFDGTWVTRNKDEFFHFVPWRNYFFKYQPQVLVIDESLTPSLRIYDNLEEEFCVNESDSTLIVFQNGTSKDKIIFIIPGESIKVGPDFDKYEFFCTKNVTSKFI